VLVIAAVFALAIGAEVFLARRTKRPPYVRAEVETTLGLLAGWVAMTILGTFLLRDVNAYSFAVRFAETGAMVGAPLVLLVAGDFLYYWAHRASHAVRWLWASHAVHHSTTRLNFLASLRQGWTDLLSGVWLFWLPLGVIGFAPASWSFYFVALLCWQLWIHNEWMGRVGVLEYVFVTPAHHRVHHSLRPEHLDRNFGGIFIVWDRLFGTFVDEGAVPLTEFGLDGGRGRATHPVIAAFEEWRRLLSDAQASSTWRQAASCLVLRDRR
jgi:sterol desaturase/sphingolipid hydroxylase (fatty acid hydroxylase superfamily)